MKSITLCLVAFAMVSSAHAGEKCRQHVVAYYPSHAQSSVVHVKTSETRAVAEPKLDIVDTAVSAETFKTLVAAVKAAGLVDTLKSDGPFTVFAPNDAAFAKLPEGTVENLLLPENKEKLIAILKYHVVPGKVMASDVVKLKSAKTVYGKEVTVKVKDETVMIDKSKVIATDIAATNGVIHVIDSVLIP